MDIVTVTMMSVFFLGSLCFVALLLTKKFRYTLQKKPYVVAHMFDLIGNRLTEVKTHIVNLDDGVTTFSNSDKEYVLDLSQIVERPTGIRKKAEYHLSYHIRQALPLHFERTKLKLQEEIDLNSARLLKEIANENVWTGYIRGLRPSNLGIKIRPIHLLIIGICLIAIVCIVLFYPQISAKLLPPR